MLSKNNKAEQAEKYANHVNRYSIRRLNLGVVSLVIGTGILFSSQTASANQVPPANPKEEPQTNTTQQLTKADTTQQQAISNRSNQTVALHSATETHPQDTQVKTDLNQNPLNVKHVPIVSQAQVQTTKYQVNGNQNPESSQIKEQNNKFASIGEIIPVYINPTTHQQERIKIDGKLVPGTPYTDNPNNPQGQYETPVPEIPNYTPHRVSVNPKDPSKNTPVVYSPVIETKSLNVSGSLNINYSGAGPATPNNVSKSYTFTGTETDNLATGQITKKWDKDSYTFSGKYVSPQIPTFFVPRDQQVISNVTITPEKPNVTINVKYEKLGYIIPLIKGTDKPVPGVPTEIMYNNDRSKGADEFQTKVPTAQGYTPDQTSVNPTDPSKPTKVYYTPVSAPAKDITKTITQKIIYQGLPDNLIPKNQADNQQVTFNGKSVTSASGQTKVTWDSESQTFKSVNVPVVNGYYTDKAEVGGGKVTPESSNQTITVTYHKLGEIIPVYLGADKKPVRITVDGKPVAGTPYINNPKNPTEAMNTPVPQIANYTPTKVTVIPPKDLSQPTQVIYEPVITHQTKVITVIESIIYKGAGAATPQNIMRSHTFTATETDNLATGQKTIKWDDPSYTFKAVETPYRAGFFVPKDQQTIKSFTVKPDLEHPEKLNITITVTYQPLNYIIPRIKNTDKPVPGLPSEIRYNNDRSKGPDEFKTEVPQVAGYTPDQTSVNPTNPSKPTIVYYTPVSGPAKKETKTITQKIIYQGLPENLIPKNKEDNQQVTVEKNGPSKAFKSVKVPVIKGYYTNVTEVGGGKVTADSSDQTITVTYHKLGEIIPVYIGADNKPVRITVDGKPVPGIPYFNNPDNPTEALKTAVPEIKNYAATKTSVIPPKDLSQSTEVIYEPVVTHSEVKTTVTEKIIYEGAGSDTPQNVTNSYTFTGTQTDNLATGQKTIKWDKSSITFKGVETPYRAGFFVPKDQQNIKSITFKPDLEHPEKSNVTIIVKYQALGNIIPLIKGTNKPVPGLPAKIPYNNDRAKGPDEFKTEVPQVAGYVPDQTSVNPSDPSADTKVYYTLKKETKPSDNQPADKTDTHHSSSQETPVPSGNKNNENSGNQPSAGKTTHQSEKTNQTQATPEVKTQTAQSGISPSQNVPLSFNNPRVSGHQNSFIPQAVIPSAQSSQVNSPAEINQEPSLPQLGTKPSSSQVLTGLFISLVSVFLGMIGLAKNSYKEQ